MTWVVLTLCKYEDKENQEKVEALSELNLQQVYNLWLLGTSQNFVTSFFNLRIKQKNKNKIQKYTLYK